VTPPPHHHSYFPEPEFVNISRTQESIPRNLFLGALNVNKIGLSYSVDISFKDDVTAILLFVFPSCLQEYSTQTAPQHSGGFIKDEYYS
jgi:hypothetical protein